jgi:hypothetical protein
MHLHSNVGSAPESGRELLEPDSSIGWPTPWREDMMRLHSNLPLVVESAPRPGRNMRESASGEKHQLADERRPFDATRRRLQL